MKKIFLSFLFIACSFNAPELKAEENALGGYVGSITLGSTTESVSGLAYEYTLSESWGVALNYDKYDYKERESRSNVFIGAHYYPIENLQLGFGLTSESSDDGTEAGARLSVGYAIHMSKLVITPAYRKYPNASELGVTLQLKF